MSVASVNAANPYIYLQSVLQSGAGSGGTNQVSNPLSALFAAFTGASAIGSSGSGGNAATGTSRCPERPVRASARRHCRR